MEPQNDDASSSKHILEYYKKYSQNRHLPKYFSGTSISYIPEIAENLEHDDHSRASSVMSNRKLEWDNGADIGYDNLQKSASLPSLIEPEPKPTAPEPNLSDNESTSSGERRIKTFTETLTYMKAKIGNPDAHSTPKSPVKPPRKVKINRSTSLDNMKKAAVVNLCVTKPVTVECLHEVRVDVACKTVQTHFDSHSQLVQTELPPKQNRSSHSKLVQTDFVAPPPPPKPNQNVFYFQAATPSSSSSNAHVSSSNCDSFEYVKKIGETNSVLRRTENNENLAQSDSSSFEKNYLDLLIKLLKSKKYDKPTKRRYVKKLVQKMASNSTTSDVSSELFRPKKSGDLQSNVPWFPATAPAQSSEAEIVPVDSEVKKCTRFTLTNNEFAVGGSLERRYESTLSKSEYSWRDDKTLSEKLLEKKQDQVVVFARKERQHQVDWINNEIEHLRKLKGLLEKEESASSSSSSESKKPHKSTTVYTVSSDQADNASPRNYIIETEFRTNIDNDNEIKVTSSESTTRVQVAKTMCLVCKQMACNCVNLRNSPRHCMCWWCQKNPYQCKCVANADAGSTCGRCNLSPCFCANLVDINFEFVPKEPKVAEVPSAAVNVDRVCKCLKATECNCGIFEKLKEYCATILREKNEQIGKILSDNAVQTSPQPQINAETEVRAPTPDLPPIASAVQPNESTEITAEGLPSSSMEFRAQTDFLKSKTSSSDKRSASEEVEIDVPEKPEVVYVCTDASSSSGTSTNSMVPSLSSNETESQSNSLIECACCKQKTLPENTSLIVSEHRYPLCRICITKNPAVTTICFDSKEHICTCYTEVNSNKLNKLNESSLDCCCATSSSKCNCGNPIEDEIKPPLRCKCKSRKNSSISEANKRRTSDATYCTCTRPMTASKQSQYCSHCMSKLTKTVRNSNAIAYTLTLENRTIGEQSPTPVKKKSLQEIRVKVPCPYRKKAKNRENKQKRKVVREEKENEVSAEKIDEMDNVSKADENSTPLQEYLHQNRPDFVSAADFRRQSVQSAKSKREENGDSGKLKFFKENSHLKNTKDGAKLFSSKEMRDINRKNYKKLPEVQSGLHKQREQKIRDANKLIVDLFAKKLQCAVLKGKRNFPLDANVINIHK